MEAIMKILLLLSLATTVAQCREYHYNKANVPFNREDGNQQQQYVLPYSTMTIPGSHGRKYEVSLTPSRNIFEMHLGHHQYYTQPQPNKVAAYNQLPLGGVYNPQSINTYSQQPANTYHQQYPAYPQKSGTTYPQQQSNAFIQQFSYKPTSAFAPIIKTPNLANMVTSPHNANIQSQLNLKRRANPRNLKICYTSGQCEYVNDNQHLQRILQQSPTKLSSNPSKAQLSQMPFASINGANKAQRDRRLFPYSEVQIAQYPFKK